MKKRGGHVVAVTVLVAVLAATVMANGAGGTIDRSAEQPPSVVSPQEAVDELARVDPKAVAPSVPDVVGGYTISDPSLSGTVRSGFKIVGSYIRGMIGGAARAGARLDLGPTSLTVAPVGIAATATPAVTVAGGDAVIYANTEPGADLLVRPTDSGVETFTQIRDVQAPESYTWTMKSTGGGSLAPTGDGGAVFSDPAGHALAEVLPVWVEDAAGAHIPATLTVAGSEMTMTVSHRTPGTVYPVVADPEVVIASSSSETAKQRAEQGARCIAALKDLSACNTAWTVKGWAFDESRAQFPGRTGEGQIGDAYRHCLWSGFMTWRLGANRAKAIADIHEVVVVNSPRGRKMDLYNNAIARKYATPYVGSRNHAAADNNGVRWPCMNKGIRGSGHQLVWYGAGV